MKPAKTNEYCRFCLISKNLLTQKHKKVNNPENKKILQHETKCYEMQSSDRTEHAKKILIRRNMNGIFN